MTNNKPLTINNEKPKGTSLNKKTIVALVSIGIAVIVIAFILALSPSHNVKSSTNNFSATHLHGPKLAKIKSLPTSYADAKSINKYLRRDHGNKLPAAVQKELNQLRIQQQLLQQQLAAVKKSNHPAYNPYQNSALDQEAKTSSIFFAGGNPSPLPTQKQTTQTNNISKNSTPDKSLSGKENSYSKQNMQEQKLDFLHSKPTKKIYNPNTIQYPASKYIIQEGTIIPAILQSKIVSNLPGMITAIVSNNVYDSIAGEYLLIPKGSKLIGEYNSKISYGQSQLQAKFLRLIRPDGTSIVLPNQPGINSMGVSGFNDEVNNHWGKVLGSAALMTIFNIPAIVATNQMNNSSSGCIYDPDNPYACNPSYNLGHTVTASALQSVGQSVSQVGDKIAQRSLNIQPTIVIHAGYNFSVMVTKDMILPPYNI